MTSHRDAHDILDLLHRDHLRVEDLFTLAVAAPRRNRGALIHQLVPELVRHEVAEEIVVYPAILAGAPSGAAEAEPRLDEQAAAERQLAEMEDVDPASDDFAARLTRLRLAVLAHAKAEEEHVFSLLRALASPEARGELGARYERARASAPSHPHPGAPDTAPGDTTVGPFTALFDRVRDAARSV